MCMSILQDLNTALLSRSTLRLGRWDRATGFALTVSICKGVPLFWSIAGPFNEQQAAGHFNSQSQQGDKPGISINVH